MLFLLFFDELLLLLGVDIKFILILLLGILFYINRRPLMAIIKKILV